LKKLRNLDLRHNQISTIPNKIGDLKYLSYIHLGDNPIRQPKNVKEMLLKENRFRKVHL